MQKIEEEVNLQLEKLLDEFKNEMLTPNQTIELIKVLFVEDVKYVDC